MRNVFGWSLPPGCTQRHIDEAAGVDAPCAVCALPAEDCVCPECHVCGQQGDPDCYSTAGLGHGLSLNRQQVELRARARIRALQDRIADEEQYLAWLEEQDEAKFSLELAESPDPWG